MITVAGEALMDVIAERSGSLRALPGGAPFNVARTVARLGCRCTFLGVLSDDALGERLRAALIEAGVTLGVPAASQAPTTLALAQLDERGVAGYRFYLQGTSAAMLQASDIPTGLLERSHALALGGLGLVIEPTGSTLLQALSRSSPRTVVILDPNCRPTAISDLGRFRERIATILPRVDVVKLSAEDLRRLAGEGDLRAAARRMLDQGPAAVLLTDGPAPVRVLSPGAERAVPVPDVKVVDTIGAGDAFVAGFLAWWRLQGCGRAEIASMDLLVSAAAAAVEVASAGCTVQGADLPKDFRWAAAAGSPRW